MSHLCRWLGSFWSPLRMGGGCLLYHFSFPKLVPFFLAEKSGRFGEVYLLTKWDDPPGRFW